MHSKFYQRLILSVFSGIVLLLLSACTIEGDIAKTNYEVKLTAPTLNAVIIGQSYSLQPENVQGKMNYTLTGTGTGSVVNNSISASNPGAITVTASDSQGTSTTLNLVAVHPLGTGMSSTLNIQQGGTSQITPLGGLAPFTYQVTSGTLTIDSAGLITATATPSVGAVRITDALNETFDISVTIYTTYTFTATQSTITSANSSTVAATGGLGGPYTYSVVSGPGSINPSTGVFTPTTAGTTVVQVNDSGGLTQQITLTIQPALVISPATWTLAVNNTKTFTATGGVAPLSYSVIAGTGTIVAATGAYTAPAGSGSASVRVTDSLGNTSDSSVTINPALTISPKTWLVTNGSYTFTATGGVSPYSYSVNAGTGTIAAATGVYTAPASSETTTVRVTDSIGNISDTTFLVSPLPSISPASQYLLTNGTISFSTTNGASPYSYSIASGGGSINASTGFFTAPATAQTVTVRSTDSVGNISNATITVYASLSLSPNNPTITINTTQSFSAVGGVGPFTYSMQTSIGGSVNATTGLYSAPGVVGSEVIKITDFIGNTATTNITLQDWIDLTISANTNNYNFYTAAGSPSVAANYRVTINAGVIVGSASTGSYAFTTGSGWPVGTQLQIINNGTIMGAGGYGGNGNGDHGGNSGGYYFINHNGGAGGPAINAQFAVAISNNGTIAGGGGGGGGGGGEFTGTFGAGGGGGGGQGSVGGSGGSQGGGVIGGSNGSSGSSVAAGSAGAAGNGQPSSGGNGGALGMPGSAGISGTSGGPLWPDPGSGGAAGYYAVGNANITWSVNGTKLGNVSP